jgi:hypothetical protein
MEDGRYLIFYTFDEEAAGDDRPRRADTSDAGAQARRADETTDETAAAGEERRV